MRSSSSATCSRSGSATTCAERGFEARCAEVLSDRRGATDGRLHGRQPRLPGRRRDARSRRRAAPRRPDRRRRLRRSASLLSHGDALCIDDVGYQRFRARRAQAGACSARSARCRWPRGARSARALRRRSGRREPPTRRHVRRRRRRRRASPGCAPRERRRWSTATPTARAATTLAPGCVRHVLSDWELDGSSRAARRGAALERARLRADRARDADAAAGAARRDRLVAPLARARARSSAGRSPTPLWQLTLARYPVPRRAQRAEARRSCARWRRSFSPQKEFTGARGLEVTDEMAVAIAAQACLPVLELGLDWLRRLRRHRRPRRRGRRAARGRGRRRRRPRVRRGADAARR